MTTPPGADPVPIACSLDAAALGERTEEWRALAQREKHCCPFFEVSLALEADRRTLVLAVPDGAEEVLAAFAALLSA